MLKFISENDGIKCVSEVFEWDDFDKALDKLENGKPMLRCCVNIDPISSKYSKWVILFILYWNFKIFLKFKFIIENVSISF